MSQKRKTYSATFKAKVALAAQRQDKTISQLAAQFKVHPIVISRWKAQLLDNAEQVFQDKRAKKKSDDRTHDDLYQEIGRLKVELDWIKKSPTCSIERKTTHCRTQSFNTIMQPSMSVTRTTTLYILLRTRTSNARRYRLDDTYRPLSLRVSDVWITSACTPIWYQ